MHEVLVQGLALENKNKHINNRGDMSMPKVPQLALRKAVIVSAIYLTQTLSHLEKGTSMKKLPLWASEGNVIN